MMTGELPPPEPKAGERALGCPHVDVEDLGLAYWWGARIRVTRLEPYAVFEATWLCLCTECHLNYAEHKVADSLVSQDFLVPEDVELRDPD